MFQTIKQIFNLFDQNKSKLECTHIILLKALTPTLSPWLRATGCRGVIPVQQCLTQCLIKLGLDYQASMLELESIKISIKHYQGLIQASNQLLDYQTRLSQAFESSI